MNKSKKGFTLIELMVVISVIAILSTIALFGFSKAQASARDVSRGQVMNGIRAALERYYGDVGNYPYSAPNNTFCGMLSLLTTGSYLTVNPTDPKTKGDLCVTVAGGCQVAAGVPTCGGATYTYTPGANGVNFSLILTKEAGGSQTFTSPQ